MNVHFWACKERSGPMTGSWFIMLDTGKGSFWYVRTRTGDDMMKAIRMALDHGFFLGYPLADYSWPPS